MRLYENIVNKKMYIYEEGEDCLYVEQFIPSKVEKYGVELTTQFPAADTLRLTGKGYPFGKIAVRVPSWCDAPVFSVRPKMEQGYAVFPVGQDFELTVTYPQRAKFVYANTRVFNNVGRAALTYGPVVYCLEGIDNGGTITDLFVDTSSTVTEKPSTFQPLRALVCKGIRVASSEALYSTEPPKKKEVTLTYIPYYTFANRGEQNMQVWVNFVNS